MTEEIHYCHMDCGHVAKFYSETRKTWRCSEKFYECEGWLRKQYNSHKKLYVDGYISPMKGKHHSKETKKKISESKKNKENIKKRNLHIFKDNKEYKKCGHCHELKLLNEFQNNKTAWDNLTWYCRKCNNIFKSNYRKTHTKERSEYQRNRRKNNIVVSLRDRISSNIKNILKSKNVIKNLKTNEYLSCSYSEAYERLMKTLPEGASEQDFINGKVHIDHIIPCASFDLTKKEEQLKCFNINNLQLLWAEDNLRKGCKII